MVTKPIKMVAAATLAAALAACQTSTLDEEASVDQTPVQSGSQETTPDVVTPVFNPVRTLFPLTIDFLLSGSTDGTFIYSEALDSDGEEIPMLTATGGLNPDYNPVYSALHDLEGFSTNSPLYVHFNGALASEQANGSVYLVPLDYGDSPKTGSLNTSLPYRVNSIPAIQVEVVSMPGEVTNSTLKISPLEPLLSDTRYLVILLESLVDANGQAVDMPNQYEYLLGELDLLDAALAGARDSVQAWQQLAEGFVASVAGRDQAVVMAYTFTTTSTTDVLNAMAAPGNADAQLTNASVPASAQYYLNTTEDDQATQLATLTGLLGDAALAQTLMQSYAGLATLPAPTPRATDFSASAPVATGLLVEGAESSFRTGRIELPYYLKAPSGGYSGEDPTSGYACSEATLECGAQQLTAANLISSQWESDEDLLYNLTLALTGDEATADALRAPSNNVTALYPFADRQGTLSVPLMAVEPVAECDKPEAGWPVVIYQHGLRSNRTETLPLAEQFAQACYVTLAMDLPLHGPVPTTNFTFDAGAVDVQVPLLAAILASENSAYDLATFLSLDSDTQALLVGSQTLSQRHFGLTADASGSPTPMSSTDGSLNGSGSLYINFLHFQTSRDNSRQGVMDLLNLNASVPFIDLDGDSAPDLDASNMFFAGLSLGSIVGSQFVAVNNANLLDANSVGNSALNRIQAAVFGVPGGGLAKLLEHSDVYGSTIVSSLTNPDTFNLVQGSDSYEALMQVYQATVDASDPLNFAAQLQATGTPFSLIKTVGDRVIPNSVSDAPLSGTDPLISALSASAVDSDTNLGSLSPVQIAVSLTDDLSSHTSMAVPDLDDATAETPATFALIASHILSLFADPTNPSLDDSGAGIIETLED